MATFLFNPTNEELSGQYGGRTFIIPAMGGRLKVEDACGRHLLNFLGDRGLTFLEIDTDIQKVADDAIRRNLAFKKRMVVEYNQAQESRKAVGMSFMPATKEVKRYAEELGLALSEPYAVREDQGMIEQMKAQIGMLTATIQKLLTGNPDEIKKLSGMEVLDPSQPGAHTKINLDEIQSQTKEDIMLDRQGPPEPQDPDLVLHAPVKIGAPARLKRRE